MIDINTECVVIYVTNLPAKIQKHPPTPTSVKTRKRRGIFSPIQPLLKKQRFPSFSHSPLELNQCPMIVMSIMMIIQG